MHRDADGACLVGNRTGDGLAYPPGGVGGEFVAAPIFEFIHRFHQADIAFLNQIEELQAAVGVFFGDGNHQAQVGLNHFSLGGGGFFFVRHHVFADFFQLGNGNLRVLLLFDKDILLFDNGILEAAQGFAPHAVFTDFSLHPV